MQHPVTIRRAFYLQVTEVTLAQWRALMGKKIFGARQGEKNMPAVRVSWYDAMDFIKKLNELGEGTYRLPTEAEWEYACRAGSTTAYSWGGRIDCSKAIYANNKLKSDGCVKYNQSKGIPPNSPAPVKSLQPNAWGLYDMHGNVWEWCSDWYGDYPQKAVTDPKGPESGTMRVRRGGSWYKFGYHCRSANRNFGHPASQYRTIGFRVVKELD
jgi:formylglycine-generating enzyme required for sulfatase activity